MQVRTCETTCGNWVADVMREGCHCEVALLTSGCLRADVVCAPPPCGTTWPIRRGRGARSFISTARGVGLRESRASSHVVRCRLVYCTVQYYTREYSL